LRILLGLLLVGILLIVLRVLGARGNYADGNHQKCGESCQYLRHKATRKASNFMENTCRILQG
jgi:hypothetical protein